MYKNTNIRYDKPIDKKTNYVKRCVGIAGDSLQIKNGNIFINGKLSELPLRAKPQFFYTLITKNPLDQSFLNNFGITETAIKILSAQNISSSSVTTMNAKPSNF